MNKMRLQKFKTVKEDIEEEEIKEAETSFRRRDFKRISDEDPPNADNV